MIIGLKRQCRIKFCRESWLVRFNPLTTNDNYSCRQNLAASVLKLSSALAERVGQGEVGW